MAATSASSTRLRTHRGIWQYYADKAPIWFSGMLLGIGLLMIVSLITLLAVFGLGTFWPRPLWEITLKDKAHHMGLVHKVEFIPATLGSDGHPQRRTLLRVGNRDLYGSDFLWIDDAQVATRSQPDDAVVVERLEWGPFYGFIKEVGTPLAQVKENPDKLWRAVVTQMPAARKRLARIRHIERRVVGDMSYDLEKHRLALRKMELAGGKAGGSATSLQEHKRAIEQIEARYETIAKELQNKRDEDSQYTVTLAGLEGGTKTLPISSLVRIHRPNRLSIFGKVRIYAERMAEFLFGQSREANSEGGVAPAIFGTVMMTLLMSIAVVPFGVLAALYLHEYAKQGWLVSCVRIAVNNLAGVPSIVFGVFGLGFFCYLIGGTIDQLFYPERLPSPTFGGGGIIWAALTLALLTVPVVIVATEEALAAVPNGVRAASLACGATKFQTIRRVVLPAAIPGILTGAILAMARGAGEVAPLMITGVVKLAPELPLDHLPPFFHLERKFMHLGFHIYDVGFQSPNVEASKAMVFMTALLLLGIVLCLNFTAMQIRGKLREQFRQAEV